MTADAHRSPLVFPLQQRRLANGLTVITHFDPSLPIVAVNLWYQVGSKDETLGRTGLAHLFEHLMFDGSAHHDDEYFKPLQQAGGAINGSTSPDRTNFYEVVPTNFLELALALEADRMGWLLPVLTADKLEHERSVVINERRQRIDNQPYGQVSETINRRLYPEGHPYSWPVIGWLGDLQAMNLQTVTDFGRRHHHPANACLMVVGCFDDRKLQHWVDRYFGVIPAGPEVLRRRPDVDLLAHDVVHPADEAVALGRIDLVWPTPPRFHPDEPALDFIAHILGGPSKDSRLKRRLLIDDRLVTSISAHHGTQFLAGKFLIRALALPGIPLDRIEAAIMDELERIQREPPTAAELTRVRRAVLGDAYSRVETVLGRAEALQHYRFFAGEVHEASFIDEIASYESVTADDIARVLDQYLKDRRKLVHRVTPSPSAKRTVGADPSTPPFERIGRCDPLPEPGPASAFQLPLMQSHRHPSGLTIWNVNLPRFPKAVMRLILDAGSVTEPGNQLGLATLTAAALDEGTQRQTGAELAGALELLGAELSVSAGLEHTTIHLHSLKETLSPAMGLMGEVLAMPRFDAGDVDRERDRLKASLAHHATEPSWLANQAIDTVLFGDLHPYGRPADGTPDSLTALGATDVRDFYARWHRPGNAVLIAVGDVSMAETCDLVDQHWSHWLQGGSTPGASAHDPAWHATSTAPRVTIIDRPGAAQSVIRIGKASVPRHCDDYSALLLINSILGGQFASRLNLNLRSKRGYTYGAHCSLALRRRTGAIIAGADVQSSATRSAVEEVIREFDGLTTSAPITAAELRFAQDYLTRRFPARFETADNIASHLAHLAIYRLPIDDYSHYLDRIAAQTLDRIHVAAARYFAPDGLHVVAVGDPTACQSLHDLEVET